MTEFQMGNEIIEPIISNIYPKGAVLTKNDNEVSPEHRFWIIQVSGIILKCCGK